MSVSNCVDGVERRGNIYYLRWRVPAEFRAVESRTEINQSLKTCDEAEARATAFLKKNALRKLWKARLLQANEGPSAEAFEAAVALLDDLQLPYIPVQGLLAGPLEELVARIEKLDGISADSPAIPAALGVCDVPHIKIRDMPKIMEERWEHKGKGSTRIRFGSGATATSTPHGSSLRSSRTRTCMRSPRTTHDDTTIIGRIE
jgi:hypothetical protein